MFRKLKREDITDKDIERFFSHVNQEGPNGCWIYTGFLNRGYGRFRFPDRVLEAHRFSWLIHFGELPRFNYKTRSTVCHKCDVPACVNPDHLFLGTPRDNIHDMYAKGRGINGEKQGNSKLKEKEVLEIRAKYIPYKYTMKMLAEEYGVLQSAIWKIIHNQRWKHLP